MLHNAQHYACVSEDTLCVMFVITTDCEQAAWLERVDYMAMGATSSIEKNSIDECQDYCAGDQSCVGIDVGRDDEPKQCSPHTGPNAFISDNIVNQTGTTSYELITTCSSNRS